MKVGDLVISINGEWGWLERFGGPHSSPWAMVRNADGFAQSFGLPHLRRPDPESDWEVFAHLENQLAEAQRLAAE